MEFSNLSYVKRAVQELARDGAKVSFIEGTADAPAMMRGVGGRMLAMDAVIKIEGGPWDVGLTKNPATNKYDITVESDMGLREQSHGGLGSENTSKTIGGQFCQTDHQSRMIGRLSQRYNLIRDEVLATQKGYITRRLKGADGVMMLEAEQR